jgi:hypothetical protein
MMSVKIVIKLSKTNCGRPTKLILGGKTGRMKNVTVRGILFDQWPNAYSMAKKRQKICASNKTLPCKI